jgi:hypothetical protein
MTVRFTCTACRTVMKLDSAVSEERKVRCTGCRIVILLTPDPDEPDGMRVSIPKKSDKSKDMPASHKRTLLIVALVIMALVVAVGLWLTLRGPQERWPISGEVALDGAPLEKGTIEFVTDGAKKEINASAPIVRGRYELRASQGPGLGKNKVKITGGDGIMVHPRFSSDKTPLGADIGATNNSQNFDVTSK